MHWPWLLAFSATADAICTGVAFRGGGSFGAVEVGMLAALQNQGLESADLLTGISAGGLNAGFLASHMATGSSFTDSTNALGKLYAGLINKDIYDFHLFSILSSWSLYQTAPLNATIQRVLGALPLVQPPPKTIIGTSNLLTGLLDVVEYDAVADDEKVAILMATSAIPFVFPPIPRNGSLFVDGGLIANELLFQSLRYFTCPAPTLWFFEPSLSIAPVPAVDSLTSYIHRILSLLLNGFDDQLQKIIGLHGGCTRHITLQICYPNATGAAQLAKYSLLEFGNGAELFQIGYSSVECQQRSLCL